MLKKLFWIPGLCLFFILLSSFSVGYSTTQSSSCWMSIQFSNTSTSNSSANFLNFGDYGGQVNFYSIAAASNVGDEILLDGNSTLAVIFQMNSPHPGGKFKIWNIGSGFYQEVSIPQNSVLLNEIILPYVCGQGYSSGWYE